jgi:RNA polymerase sigma-70 factor, ECF subfamily
MRLFASDLENNETAYEQSDAALVRALRLGDLRAAEALFERYSGSLRIVAHRVLRDSFEAEDVVQDLFSELPTKSSTFDESRGSVRSWLFKIAFHCAISRRRHLTSRWFYGQVELDTIERLPAKDRKNIAVVPDVHLSLQKLELGKLFELLSENQRRTLELFFCEGYTLDEIAAELGQSKGNVRHHYFRGLEKLRKEVFSKQLQGNRV